jgi:predicted Zn-dependent protease
MSEWNSIKLPLRLVEARSLRESDIVVDVIEAIPGQDRADRDQAGVTTVTHESGTILRARVFVAVSAPFGVRYSVADQVANLTHELGHALGLPHTDQSRALMSRRRSVEELTAVDIALARRHFTCAAPGS